MEELYRWSYERAEDNLQAETRVLFNWAEYWQSVHDWCHSLVLCVTVVKIKTKSSSPFPPMTMSFPMQIIAVHLLRPLLITSLGNKYILVAGDYFTKWMEVYAIPNQEDRTVAMPVNWLMRCSFDFLYQNNYVHSDQGGQFEAKVVSQLYKLFHIKKTHTSLYHLQANILIERFNALC